MQKTGLRAITWIALVSVGLLASCTGEDKAGNVIVVGELHRRGQGRQRHR
jgi:hypothetical protein